MDSLEELPRLQGSKYAHSSTEGIYRQVREQAESGRLVLFSGTPCQVDGLYGFLRGKTYENLYTVDLICHGVPDAAMLEYYIRHMERTQHIHVTSLSFRGKREGWGTFNYRLRYRTRRGAEREIERPANRSSFYRLFLHGTIYKEACYACPYASMARVSDLTIGDWWGIDREYPAYIGEGAHQFRRADGISCLLVNTEHGEAALAQFGADLHIEPTDPAAVAKGNRQLREPQVPSPDREEVMARYRNGGWAAVEWWYGRQLGYKRWVYRVYDRCRDWLRH